MTDIKKYLPFVAIGAVVIWLVLKLSKSGSDSQVVNRVIPVQGEDNTVALRQIDAQYALGKLQLENEAAIADKQVQAENQRLDFQNKALDLTAQYNLKALDIQAQRDQNLAAIARDTSLTDANLRLNAAQELQRQANTSSLLNSLMGLGSGLLQSLLRNQQQSRSGGSGGTSGGTSGGSTTPQRQPQRQANYNLIARILDRFRNQPYIFSNSSLADQYVPYLDLQPYYQNEVNAYDKWLDYGNDLTGNVTSNYDFGSIYLPSFDDPNFWIEYNEAFGA